MLALLPAFMKALEKIQRVQTGSGLIFQPASIAVFAFRFVRWRVQYWQKSAQNCKRRLLDGVKPALKVGQLAPFFVICLVLPVFSHRAI